MFSSRGEENGLIVKDPCMSPLTDLPYFKLLTLNFFCPLLSRKRGDIKSHLSVRLSVPLSVCHKNFNLGHNFCTITGRALILGMCVLCD